MQVLVKKDIGKLWNNVFKYKRINKDELINYDVPQNVPSFVLFKKSHPIMDDITCMICKGTVKHANELTCRADMTVHAMCAWINKAFNEFEIEKINLQRELEQHMHSSINTLGLLGISYENTKNYDEALKMYFTILNIINEVFKEDDYVPVLYRLEMGNIYAMIARTYLEMGNIDECLNYLEQMVDVEIYYNKVKVKEFKINNKYLDKSGTYNYANYRAFDKDSDVLCSLDLECFILLDIIKDLKKL